MAQVKLISVLRFKSTIGKLNETRGLVFKKVESADCGNLSYFHASCNKLDLMISKNVDELRNSRPIKGTKASLDRLLFTVGCMNKEIELLLESAFRGEPITKGAIDEKLKPLSEEYISESQSFIEKTFRILVREVKGDKIIAESLIKELSDIATSA
ncbi:hypothetical protein PZE06_18830 [Robertmurraya sp. DFI.2.37]|uniref:hypothetical protein n=1 Tax=Robertmurraya sp. DFI.2.37 TaxID=3031819 RepID=UPI0023DA4A56|nr:hypothetical protein [Robertmurraya sp. DFI.2.37]MDF1510193.1 hypothetical protein [Robertmurraya sp. DFI.2.37]